MYWGLYLKQIFTEKHKLRILLKLFTTPSTSVYVTFGYEIATWKFLLISLWHNVILNDSYGTHRNWMCSSRPSYFLHAYCEMTSQKSPNVVFLSEQPSRSSCDISSKYSGPELSFTLSGKSLILFFRNLFIYLFILCVLNNMYLAPIHSPSLRILLLPLQHLPPKKQNSR